MQRVVPAIAQRPVVHLSASKHQWFQRRFELEQSQVSQELFVSDLPARAAGEAAVATAAGGARSGGQADGSAVVGGGDATTGELASGAGVTAGAGLAGAGSGSGAATAAATAGAGSGTSISIHASGMAMGDPMDGVRPPGRVDVPASVSRGDLPFSDGVASMMMAGLHAHLRSMGIDPAAAGPKGSDSES